MHGNGQHQHQGESTLSTAINVWQSPAKFRRAHFDL